MARLARLYLPNQPQHVLLRTCDGATAFVDEADRQRFLACLRQALKEDAKVALHGYALLADRVFWLGTPADEAAMSRLVQGVGRRYVSYYNRRHGRSGRLWEARYRATVIDAEQYLLLCTCCDETAAVAAGLANTPQDWRWSSYAHHVGLTVDPLVTDHAVYWALGNTPFERQRAYRERCEQPVAPDQRLALERATMSGWLLGGEAWLTRHARQANRRALPLKRGRRAKEMTNSEPLSEAEST